MFLFEILAFTLFRAAFFYGAPSRRLRTVPGNQAARTVTRNFSTSTLS
jgi:hypothetical protein